ncbi:hypothetical protein YS76_004795 [Salmonella enterica subsp. enterica serovar Oranienburg]|nr:hypothetical protein [Salmonella enterica subsp. enterica serovar Oranienburg]EEC0861687.1 hypothetical protein [Salmonella enterica subsp. enterica serovar Soumbedioune]EEH0730578.1 hypothetical protein [Salmonella enterica]EEJ2343477.1 hypothetical protein [Salmonella enterica subsp. enterica serovar Oslo]EDU4202225.1 hypothetical protein [Salmonella enterica subsp. enterica serovar Oranienburg]
MPGPLWSRTAAFSLLTGHMASQDRDAPGFGGLTPVPYETTACRLTCR